MKPEAEVLADTSEGMNSLRLRKGFGYWGCEAMRTFDFVCDFDTLHTHRTNSCEIKKLLHRKYID